MYNPPYLILKPKVGTPAAQCITANSGIVGVPAEDTVEKSYLVYFEGNLYNAQNLKTLEERIKCAAGRLAQEYPTIARGIFPMDEFDVIGQVSYSFNDPNNHWWVQLRSEPK